MYHLPKITHRGGEVFMPSDEDVTPTGQELAIDDRLERQHTPLEGWHS
jgi:hypothetical protein